MAISSGRKLGREVGASIDIRNACARPLPIGRYSGPERLQAVCVSPDSRESRPMPSRRSDPSGFARRNFLQMVAAGGALAASSAGSVAELSPGSSKPSESKSNIVPQPSPEFGPELTTADIIVETLISWGATHCFGVVGDGINSIIEALRQRQDRIRYVGVRHEEAAAFMASGIAKHTGRLGVCVGTTSPGAIHLLNGLYDAHMDGAPVVAITGMTFHDLIGTRYQQGVDTTKLMQNVALYDVEVTGPEHAMLVANRACRAALGDRGVAHLTVSKDVQMMRLSADSGRWAIPAAEHRRPGRL